MNDILIDNYEHIRCDIFYTSSNIPGKGCNIEEFHTQILTKCNCNNDCSDLTVCHCVNQYGKNYECKKLSEDKLLGNYGVLECNDNCECDIKLCGNRLVQLGPLSNLKIQHFANKGYGLVTDSCIEKGQFVCEYAGEVISEQEAEFRRKMDNTNYIFVLKEHGQNKIIKTIVDATSIGNIGRYINHSCNPNCKIIPVRANSMVPILAIFAQQAIDPGLEITYSYSGTDHTNAIDCKDITKRKPCFCNSSNCMKYIPCIL